MAVSRAEQILTSMINGTPYDQYPQSRLEDLLLQLKEVIEEGGGGTPAAENVTYDNTESGATAENVQDALDEVFQSVSDGKEDIADAITDKGVPTSASDSFAIMAENIAAIPTGGGVEIIENFSGTFSLSSRGEWKPHTMTKAGYVTIMFIATYLGSAGSSAFSIQKNGVELTYTTYINSGTTQARGVYRLPVVAGDVIRCYKNSDCNTPAQYVLLFEES